MSFHKTFAPYDLWTPAELSPSLWFDAIESSYIAGTWQDISGNDYHFTQATSGSRPTYNATGLNSLPALDFDGTNDHLDAPAGALGIFNNVGQAWVLAVYRHDTADGSNIERPIFAASIGTGSGTRVQLTAGAPGTGQANKPRVGGRRLDADSFASSGDGAAMTAGQETILLGYLDYTNRTATLYQDGASVASASTLWSGGGNSSATDSLRMRAGANVTVAPPTTLLNGRVAELVVGNTALDSDDIDKLFGWAAHLYGLESVLPAMHPYKASPPTV